MRRINNYSVEYFGSDLSGNTTPSFEINNRSFGFQLIGASGNVTLQASSNDVDFGDVETVPFVDKEVIKVEAIQGVYYKIKYTGSVQKVIVTFYN